MWTSWAGWPKECITDRGLHNRGAFAKGMADHSVYQKMAPLESPEMIGRGERHGGMFKKIFKKMIKAHNIVGKHAMKLAAAEVCNVKNDFVKCGGFSPAQWVLGKSPRGIGHLLDDDEYGQLGTIEGLQDPTVEFGLRAQYRDTARKAFVKEDCSRRARAATLRKSAPVSMDYKAGDYVCYRKEQRKNQAPGTEWSTVARIIGFEGKGVWVQHEGGPVLTSLDKLRPTSTAELLAHQILNRHGDPKSAR